MSYLYDLLREYGAGDAYPFHMPGHKRRLGALRESRPDGRGDIPFRYTAERRPDGCNGILSGGTEESCGDILSACAAIDITEIEGFDNLHHAEGILREAQQRAAALYGSEETFFLVNGSTSGILSAIGACCGEGTLLMARNCHKSAYHAVFLNRLTVFVYGISVCFSRFGYLCKPFGYRLVLYGISAVC